MVGFLKNQLYKTMAGMAELARKLDTSSDLDVYLNLYPQESIQKRKFFNVGAGQFYHPCWTNVDDGSSYYENINGRSPNRIRHNLFLKTPLPVGDADAEIIYTSHTLEHIDNESVRYFLKDSHRMLKDEGVLRIVVPDIELSYRAWQKNDRHYFFWIDRENFNKDYLKQGINMPLRQASLTQIFLEDFAAAVSEITLDGAQKRISDAEMREIFNSLPFEQALDYCTSGCTIEAQIRYPFRHMNWFNETKLKLLLQEAGFEKIHRCGYLQSSAPVLRNSKYFDSSMPQISLYMEAVK